MDLTIGPSVSASMSASDSMMLGATSSVTIGATAEMTMGASPVTIGASTELALGLLNENFLGLDVTMTPGPSGCRSKHPIPGTRSGHHGSRLHVRHLERRMLFKNHSPFVFGYKVTSRQPPGHERIRARKIRDPSRPKTDTARSRAVEGDTIDVLAEEQTECTDEVDKALLVLGQACRMTIC